MRINNRIFEPNSKFDVTYIGVNDEASQKDKDNVLKYIDMVTNKLKNAPNGSNELYNIQDTAIDVLNQFYSTMTVPQEKQSSFYKELIKEKLIKLKVLLNERTDRDINDESLWHNEYDTDLDGNMHEAPTGLDLHKCATEGCPNYAVGSIHCPQCSKQTTSNIVNAILKARGPGNNKSLPDDLPDDYIPGSINLRG